LDETEQFRTVARRDLAKLFPNRNISTADVTVGFAFYALV
jgi:hypothetical protein